MILLRIYNIINFVKSYLPFKSFFSRYNPLLIIYTPLIEKASSSPTSFFFFISLRISYMPHTIPACTISTIHALSYTILHSCAILYYTYPLYRFILYLSSTYCLILSYIPVLSYIIPIPCIVLYYTYHPRAILYYTYPLYRFILYLSSTCYLILYLPPIFSNRSLYAFNCSSLILYLPPYTILYMYHLIPSYMCHIL